MTKLFIVSGDVSGDAHAARILEELRRRIPDLHASGMGGDRLAEQGMELLTHLGEFSVVGISEVLRMLPRLWRVYRGLVAAMAAQRPDLVLLVDYPDMNLRLARQAKRLGLPVVDYIVPQVWAWRESRVRLLRRNTDLCLCLFGFEEPFLRQRGVVAEFVGHPMVDAIPTPALASERAATRAALGLEGAGPWIALLPGSRRSELEHHLEIFVAAAARLREVRPDSRFVLAQADGLEFPRLPDWIHRIRGRTREVLRAVDLALVKSGTSTVEAALCGTPMVIGYRVSRSTYWLAKRLIRVPWIGMANLLAGRGVFPELVQEALTPEALAQAALEMLHKPPDPEVYRTIRENLGEPGSHQRAANRIEERLTKRRRVLT